MAEIRKNQNDATKRTDEATGADGVRRVADEFGRVFGLTGQNEDLTRQATQNLEAITQTGSVLARGFQELSPGSGWTSCRSGSRRTPKA